MGKNGRMFRVGLIGLGGIGTVHGVQYAKMPDVRLFAFDHRPERIEGFVQRFHAEPVGSYDQLLERCDVIDICVPTDLHAGLAMKAVAAGRAVLLEKPITRTLEECSALIEAADKARVTLMPAHVVRFFPDYEAAHKLVAGGAIGKPAAARLRRGGSAPQGDGKWFQDFTRSGGVLLDLAIHDFDWLQWTLGPVEQVFAQSVRANGLLASDVPGDYSLATLTHSSGAVSHCEATWMDPSGFRTTLEVCGSEGMIEHDSRQAVALSLASAQGAQTMPNLVPTDDPFYREIRTFLDCLHGKVKPPVTPTDGFIALAIALAALESARTGQPAAPVRA